MGAFAAARRRGAPDDAADSPQATSARAECAATIVADPPRAGCAADSPQAKSARGECAATIVADPEARLGQWLTAAANWETRA